MNIVTSTVGLAEICQKLSESEFITVDTEFIRETTFWPQLCLIQIAGNGIECIVDPLSNGIDLTPFLDLMADQSVTKVFHAARQDLEIIYKLSGRLPEPIFDTQVAAMVCGFGDSISYDQLVQKITGERIDKSSRFTDWRRRPLTDRQLEYALADVTHLRDVYLHLAGSLTESGRTEWVAEEMAVLTAPTTYDLHPDDAWKRLKLRARKPSELAITQKLAAWREKEARERDVPRSRVLKDDAIYEIAQQHPQDEKALSQLRTVPRGWEKSASGKAVVSIVKEVMELDREDLPKIPRPPHLPEGTGAAVEMLKVLLKIVAEREGVAPKVLASSDDLEKMAAKGEDAEIHALQGWRRSVFGEPALKLLSGGTGLRFKNKKIELIDL